MMDYYSAMRKKEILPFETTQMGLEDIMPDKVKQTKKTLNGIPYMSNLK